MSTQATSITPEKVARAATFFRRGMLAVLNSQPKSAELTKAAAAKADAFKKQSVNAVTNILGLHDITQKAAAARSAQNA